MEFDNAKVFNLQRSFVGRGKNQTAQSGSPGLKRNSARSQVSTRIGFIIECGIVLIVVRPLSVAIDGRINAARFLRFDAVAHEFEISIGRYKGYHRVLFKARITDTRVKAAIVNERRVLECE